MIHVLKSVLQAIKLSGRFLLFVLTESIVFHRITSSFFVAGFSVTMVNTLMHSQAPTWVIWFSWGMLFVSVQEKNDINWAYVFGFSFWGISYALG